MKKILFLSLTMSVLLMAACSATKGKGKNATAPAPPIQEEMLPDYVVTVPSKTAKIDTTPYRATFRKENDLVHTTIDVKFDWAKRHVLGKTTITATPHFYPTNTLVSFILKIKP